MAQRELPQRRMGEERDVVVAGQILHVDGSFHLRKF